MSAAKVFISYAHKDEEHRERLEVQLAPLQREGLIDVWHDRRITPGTHWAGVIDAELTAADIVLLLVSPDFIASDYCIEIEMQTALQRHARRETRVIPILIRPCSFERLPFAALAALPRNLRPVSKWRPKDDAWLDVGEGIRAALETRAAVTGPPDAGLSKSELTAACRAQVAEEITVRVGKKYLPDLCRRRPVEADIHRFVAGGPVPEIQRLMEALAAWTNQHGTLASVTTALAALAAVETGREVRDALVQVLADPDARELAPQIERLLRPIPVVRRRVFLVRDKAGSGKTNLLCKLAQELEGPQTLCVLLSCKFDLPASRRLDEVIAERLHPNLTAAQRPGVTLSSEQLLEQLPRALADAQSQLVVFLDGINENRQLAALDEAIVRLLQLWNGLPVRFIVTCRDIFWNFFSEEHWEPFLWGGIHTLPELAADEVDEAIAAYFDRFDIRGVLRERARERCRHPLILRFFCEAYAGTDVMSIDDLRLKDLFEEYWTRKREEVAASLGLGRQGAMRIESFLFSLVDHMADTQALQVRLGDVGGLTGEIDLDGDRSLYRRLLDQDVIFEELPPAGSVDRSYGARRIAFVYDEFCDFMLARSHVRRRGWDALSVEDRCRDVVELLQRAHEFEQLHGVVEYLVLMSESEDERASCHRELCAVLARLAQHALLRKVLPKLDRGEWMVAVLGTCLARVEELRATGGRKDARGSAAQAFDRIFGGDRDFGSDGEPRTLFERLTDGAQP